MSVNKYKQVQTQTEDKTKLGKRVIRSIASYLREAHTTPSQIKRNECLLLADKICNVACMHLVKGDEMLYDILNYTHRISLASIGSPAEENEFDDIIELLEKMSQ